MEKLRKIEELKETADSLKASLFSLKAQADIIIGQINSGHLVSVDVACDLSRALDTYRSLEHKLREIASELALYFGTKLSDMDVVICSLEEKHKQVQIKEILLDYFRLNSEAADIRSILEHSKLDLVEKCAASLYQVDMELCELLVFSAKKNKLSKDEVRRIADAFNFDLAYAADHGELFIDDAIDVTPYIDPLSLFANDEQKCPPSTQDKPDVVLSRSEMVGTEKTPENIETPEEVVDRRLPWINFGGYTSDISIHVADFMEKPSLTEVKELESQNQDTLAALWNAANEKLIAIDNCIENTSKVFSPAALNLLHDKNFLTEITLSSPTGTRQYLTLSSKGWECFKNANIKKYLLSYNPTFAIPKNLCIACGDWTPLFAARAALIHDYFSKSKHHFVLWKSTMSEITLAKSTHTSKVTVLAGLLKEGEEETDLKEIAKELDSLEGNGTALILVRTMNDIPVLEEELRELTNVEALFAVEEREYAIFDVAGTEATLLKDVAESPCDEHAFETDIIPELENPEKVHSVMISAVNSIKKDAPTAKAFKNGITTFSRQYPPVYGIIPLLTHFGILEKEQVFRFGVNMVNFPTDDDFRNAVFAALTSLSEKGLLAHYQYEDEGKTIDIYGLGAYCAACLRKQDVFSMQQWQTRCGNRNLVCGDTIVLDTVTQTVHLNDLLLEYLIAAKEKFSRKEFSFIKHTMKWTDTSYTVACFHEGTAYTCYLLPNNQENEAVSFDNVILRHELLRARKEALLNRFETIFVLTNGTVSYYDKAKGLLDADDFKLNRELDDELDELFAQDEAENLEAESRGVIDVIMPNTSSEEDKHVPDASKQTEEMRDTDAVETTKSPVTAVAKPANKSFAPEAEPQDPDAPSVSLAPSCLNLVDTPSDDDFCKRVYALLNTPAPTEQELFSSISKALLLSRTAGFVEGYEKSNRLSRRLQLASNTLFGDCSYSWTDLADAFSDADENDEALTLAAYSFALLTPTKAYDHSLFTHSKDYFYDFEAFFPHYLQFKSFFNDLLSVHDVIPTGLTSGVVSLLGSDSEIQSYISKLQHEARGYLTVPTPNKQLKALPVLYVSCFGQSSDLFDCMGIIASNKAEDLDYVKDVLSSYCTEKSGTLTLDMSKIEEKLDTAWDGANSKRKFKLEYEARAQALRHFKLRLELMLTWVELLSEQNKMGDNLTKLRILRSKLLNSINHLETQDDWKNASCANVVQYMLHRMKTMLQCRPNPWLFSDLLLTGIVSLDSNGYPILNQTLTKVRFNEPWRNVIRHIEAKKKSVSEIRDEILGAAGDFDLFDNLHQLEMLGKWLGSQDDDFVVSDQLMKQAADNAKLIRDEFHENLELAYTYNQINETEKETLAGIVRQYEGYFYTIGDFACWRRFIKGLESQIEEYAKTRQEALRTELNTRKAKVPDSTLLAEAERLLEYDRNFAVAEEYINRFDNGEQEFSDELDTVFHEKDYFSDYVSKEKSLRDLCTAKSGLALKNFGWSYLDKHLPKDWTSRQRKDSEDLVSSWPVRKNSTTASGIQKLFTCLGFEVKSAKKATVYKEEIFELSIVPTTKSKADYLHPIAVFGTQLKSPLRVVVLYGNYTGKQLVDTVSSLNLGGNSVVLIDRPIDISTKRLIGEIFHTQTSRQNPFLLIDQILLLYLAQHQITERLPALLKCALPFSSYQPFGQGHGSTPDEMFFGRTRELESIKRANGACVVYGGRQLGKTALLQRAESRCHDPESKQYAVYVSILNLDTEAKVVEALSAAISLKTNNAITITPCNTMKTFCDQLERYFMRQEVVSLHLLIDEVDDFLAAISADRYIQIQPLVDLRRQTTNNFKFVIAGLHNVCRAKNATTENGIFGQLGTPLCIKPLSPNEALHLLSRPLRYLGFQFDKNSHLETILTNTNYYPGILQFFGYMLVETLHNQYSKYYRAANGNPPFTLHKDQLGAVMSSADLNNSIKDKFRLSLALDNRYFMLARCITMLYHLYEADLRHETWLGFSVEEIREVAEAYSIYCLKNETDHECIVLLDEMVDMGILSKPGDRPLYRLRRSSFVDMIGEDLDVLEADIIKNNVEV